MGNRMIRIIRPIDNAPEKEYLKEFFRFIGCFISDCAVETELPGGWMQHLHPDNQENGIDIVINYYGEDPFAAECAQRGIKRIYCYFSFNACVNQVLDAPQQAKSGRPQARDTIRSKVLDELIDAIWADDPVTAGHLHNIAQLYVNNNQDELYYFLQAKRCLRVLSMGEILKEPSAQVSRIPLVPYIEQMMTRLWEMWVRLDGCADPYSIYTRVNAAGMMREIAHILYDGEYVKLRNISVDDVPFQLFPVEELVRQLHDLLRDAPQFVSAYLLMASLCRGSRGPELGEEACYLRTLQLTSNYKKGYAFVWYRMGYFCEKKMWDTEKALDFYRQAVKADPLCYQALFKLGYYAAAEGRFNEAEALLGRMIQAIFHGRSTDPDENGEYKNWLALSLKDSQYVYKAYMLLAKIAINSNREYSTRVYIGKACLAATRFEEAGLVRHASTRELLSYKDFDRYHRGSTPVWSMWQALKPWTENIIKDPYVRDIVRERLANWK